MSLIGKPVRQETHSEVYRDMASALNHERVRFLEVNVIGFFDEEVIEDVDEAVFVEVRHTINHQVNS